MNYQSKFLKQSKNSNKENDNRLNKINSYLQNIKGISTDKGKVEQKKSTTLKQFKGIEMKNEGKYYFKNI